MSVSNQSSASDDSQPNEKDLVRNRLIEAAERLFGEKGFESVSLRELTSAAGANVASVNYYFGSKEGLIDEIIKKHALPCNENRLANLQKLKEEHGANPIPVRDLVEAFLQPIFRELTQKEETRRFFGKIMGRLAMEKGGSLPASVLPSFHEMMSNFIPEFQKSLPEATEQEVIWKIHFSMGVVAHTLTQGETLNQVTAGRAGVPDSEKLFAQLIQYCSGGFSALLIGLLAVATLALSSCTAFSPPNEIGQVETMAPAGWTASKAAQAGVDDGWVRSLGSATLVSLAHEAVRNQPDLKIASEKVSQAASLAKLAGVPGRPTLSGNLSTNRRKQSFLGFPSSGSGASSSTYNSYGVSLDANWELDVWGRIRAGQSAAIGDWQAASYDAKAAEISLVGQVSKAWFNLAEAVEQLSLAHKALRWREESVTTIRGRFESALSDTGGTASQFQNASAEAATAQANIEQRKGEVAAAARQLELLLGRYPSGSLNSAKLGSKNLPPIPTGLPSSLLQRRPDVLAAERRFAASGARIKEAQLAAFPQIKLTASAGTSTTQLKDILDSGFGVWSLGANLIQPIVTGGQLRAEQAQRESAQRQALANLQKTVLNAFGEVEQALVRESALRKQLSAVEKAVALSESAAQSAQDDYREGVGDVLTMINTRTQIINLSSQEVTLRRLLWDNRVNLHLALGGDFRLRHK